MTQKRLSLEQEYQLNQALDFILNYYECTPKNIERVSDSNGHGWDFEYLRNGKAHTGKIRVPR